MVYFLLKPQYYHRLFISVQNFNPLRICSYLNKNQLTHLSNISRHASFEQKRISGINEETIAQKLVNQAPLSVQPYLKIIRIDKPIGNWLIIWPSTWGVALAAAPNTLPDFYLLTLFVAGSFLMRGAGCIINDIIDKDIDSKVERTMNRPLVNGTMSIPQALTLFGIDLGLALIILLQLNTFSIILGMSCMGLVITYPLLKRISYWPQVVLGLTLNWGILVGYSAVNASLDPICFPLYGAAVCWTIIYDTIYALQDIQDDLKQGVKSTAIKFGDDIKMWLTGFSAISTSGLLCTGFLAEQTWPYYSAVTFTGLHLLWQIYGGNLRNAQECGMKHKTNSLIGLILFLGIVFGNYIKSNTKNDESTNISDINVI